MDVARGVFLLVILTAGCNPVTPETQPRVVATQSDKAEPAAQPAPPTTTPTARAAPPAASAKKPPPVGTKVAPPAIDSQAAAPMLDLTTLKEQLKETKAIGILSKITLKNQVDDLLDQFREYYRGTSKFTMTGLRRSYELLMMKVMSLLQDEDQKLASDIAASREAIWALLSDSKKFAALEG